MTVPVRSASRVQRVLVVDDSAFMRKLISEMIATFPGFQVAGTARDGIDALVQIERIDPDIVTLDLQMPRLDGLEVLKEIMASAPRPVVVLSAGGEQFGDATLRALELGAVDFVRKPAGPVTLDLDPVKHHLAAALDAAATAATSIRSLQQTRVHAARSHASAPTRRYASAATAPPAERVVVVGSSTGGPRALSEIVRGLPPSLAAAVVVAQHIPAAFTAALAHRLDLASAIRVREAEDGDALIEGTVYVARGGANTVITGAPGAATLVVQPLIPPVGATPSADALFESAARIFGGRCSGVVLTGMGRDGAAGLKAVRTAGGKGLVQDEASSAIYGMPKAAMTEAGADVVASVHEMADAIVAAVSGDAQNG